MVPGAEQAWSARLKLSPEVPTRKHRWPAYAQHDLQKPVPEGEYPISHEATFDVYDSAAKTCGKVIGASLRVNLLGLPNWVFAP
jgi:hypothetical protein